MDGFGAFMRKNFYEIILCLIFSSLLVPSESASLCVVLFVFTNRCVVFVPQSRKKLKSVRLRIIRIIHWFYFYLILRLTSGTW